MSAEIETEATLAGAFADDRDVRLIEAARNGDEAAIREIYQTYFEPVWALAVSLLGDPLQAQDVVQAVFFKAFRGLRGFRFRSTLFTWIYRIARNECRSQARRRSVKAVPLESILGSRYEAEEGPAGDSDEGRADILRRAVAGLPFKLREVVVLKYQEGLSYVEMSRVLGRPPGTVASRLNRALAELEVRLRPGGGPR
jgi:RNA polymerase sigma-70 factor (ECF subfamily)